MKEKLYFMGSGEIAVPIIDKLYSSECFELVGVCTQEDKPAGRNKILTPTPVGLWAKEKGVSVVKPKSVNSDEFISHIKMRQPHLILVVSFGQILKQPILNIPVIGCINIHASLLPKYRGASPVTAAILNGDAETGVCFMQMEKGLDSGPVFNEIRYTLRGDETADELEKSLGKLAAQHVDAILSDICSGKVSGVLQDASSATNVGKIKKSDGLIDWKNKSATQIERMVRAYHPWPGAYTFIHTQKGIRKIIITSASCTDSVSSAPGKIEAANSKRFEIGASSNSVLKLNRLIPEGKKEMSAEEFLRGTRVELASECVNL
ncbi:MAG TPA: methionyl-tRNA formyltransferase [Lentisphaeria bacterium]|nr:MAG: methionyl-tRNA formyltransferase [Lentisphaerae bacterium GWF2_38_69]HBM15842.1 methionyl-tRNA formyltransferase [Lentisphaeria bacterium]